MLGLRGAVRNRQWSTGASLGGRVLHRDRPGCRSNGNRAQVLVRRTSYRRHQGANAPRMMSSKPELEGAMEIIGSDQHTGDILGLLEQRGLINQVVGHRDDLVKCLHAESVGVYLGVDPTAPSMHIGHLIPFMALSWMHMAGHKAYSIVGGATVTIGDPSGRTSARPSQSVSSRLSNTERIDAQLRHIWANVQDRHNRQSSGKMTKTLDPPTILNNESWLGQLSAMELLSVLAPQVRVGALLGRDYVRQRLDGSGLSVAEFLYPLIQAWDWWHLFSTKSVTLQIGGGDQFGNILAGMDAINQIQRTRLSQHGGRLNPPESPNGFTVPLLRTASGQKFGKSAGNAVWLDADMTSPFDLYQFFLKTADADVERHLRLLTFIPLTEITQIINKHDLEPSSRIAQHALARSVLRLVHNEDLATQAEREHALLFQSRSRSSSISDTKFILPPPTATLSRSYMTDNSIPHILHAAGLSPSISQARHLCAKSGIYIGRTVPNDDEDEIKFDNSWSQKKDLDLSRCIMHRSPGQENPILLLRIGKTKIRSVEFT